MISGWFPKWATLGLIFRRARKGKRKYVFMGLICMKNLEDF